MLEQGKIYFQGDYWAKYTINAHYHNTPIVLFHEALGSFGQWKNFPNALSEALNCPVLIWEREGYGASMPLKKKRNLSYLHEAADQWATIEQAFMNGKEYHLLGHSDGASIALLFAAHHDSPLLKSMFLLAPHVMVEKCTLSGILPAVEAYEAGKMAGLQKYHGTKTNDLFYAWSDTWLTSEFESWDVRAEMNKVNAPCLVIQGAKDQYGSYEQLQAIKDGVKGSYEELWLEGVGHHPHLEAKEEVIQAVKGFYGSYN